MGLNNDKNQRYYELYESRLFLSLCESGLQINCIATSASEASRRIDPVHLLITSQYNASVDCT